MVKKPNVDIHIMVPMVINLVIHTENVMKKNSQPKLKIGLGEHYRKYLLVIVVV